MFDCFVVVIVSYFFFGKCFVAFTSAFFHEVFFKSVLREKVYFGGAETITQGIINKEIVQFVWPYGVFCLLGNFAILISRNKFGAYRRIYYVDEGLLFFYIRCVIGNPFYKMSYKGFRNRTVYSVHTHVVAVVSGPAESKLAQVSGSYDKSVCLIGNVH